MDSVLKFVFAFDDKLTPGLGNIGKGIADNNKAIGSFGNALDNIASKSIGFQALANSFGAVTTVLNDAVAPGIAFNTGMAELSAITGFVGKDLTKLGDSARKNALVFGGDAASAAGVYQRILSDLGPDIAKNAEAMSVMANNAQIMGKTMKGDVVGAANALDTAMLQYGVDLSNPIKASKTMTEYMNVMGAAAQQGSVDVPLIAQALEKSGSLAKSAGLNFAETNAAIQALNFGSLKGAEAGTAFRSILTKMSAPSIIPKEVAERAKLLGINLEFVADTSVPLVARLGELKKGLGDKDFVASYFGEFQSGGRALLDHISYIGDMQTKITGTNATVDMANTIMNSFAERLSRSKAAMADLGITIFGSTEAMIPFMNGAVGIAEKFSQLYPAISVVTSGISWATTTIWKKIAATKADIAAEGWRNVVMSNSIVKMGIWSARMVVAGVTSVGSFVAGIVTSTASMLGFNAVVYANPIGLFIAGLVAIGGAVYLAIKHWDTLKNAVIIGAKMLMMLTPFYWITEAVNYLFPNFKKTIGGFFTSIYEDYIKPFFAVIGEIWDKLKAVVAPFSSDFNLNANVTATPAAMPSIQNGFSVVAGEPKKEKQFNYATGKYEEVSAPTEKFNYATGKLESTNKTPIATAMEGKASGALTNLNTGGDKKKKGGKDAEVQGDNKSSKIVNTRIDRIVINVNAKGEEDAMRKTGDKYAKTMIDAHRDFETIIGN